MTEQNQNLQWSEEELEKRKELFRYTDLSHPVMQALFQFKLADKKSSEN